jgi:hypothetical protein
MEPKLSIVVTSIERDINDLCNFIKSYLVMDYSKETELLILFKSLNDNNKELIDSIVNGHKNIKLFIMPGFSRCQRKDEGLRKSTAKMVAFVDSDCKIHPDYVKEIFKISNQKVIRGKNIYVSDTTWLSKNNSIYRTLCDELFFKDETFTPNLIIDKNFLQNAGGWSHDNLDSQDDFILSQRLKKQYDFEIYHASNAILYCQNQADAKLKKIIKTWYGYGLGYGFRLWRDPEHNLLYKLKRYTPPIVYTRNESLTYMLFSIFQWSVVFTGYIVGLLKHNKNKVRDMGHECRD